MRASMRTLRSSPTRRLLGTIPSVRERKATSSGFTLIELMVVVSIVAILAAVAAPSFRTMLASQRVKAAATAVNESLWMARSEALKRNASVSFVVDNAALQAGWQLKVGTTVLHTQDGFSTVAVTAGGGTYTFNSSGRMDAGAGDLQLSVASVGVNRCISVAASGRSTVKGGIC